MRLHSIEVKTKYGACEIFLTEEQKKDIEDCENGCIECNDKCEFGFVATEILII